jgi:threonine dehydrogenase-like Zn-dependent dehydrogenase
MGLKNLCRDRKIIGISYPGAFAEYVAAPATNIYPIEDPIIGSLIEPLATSYRVYRLSQASLGDRVLVIGAGAIGIFTVRLLSLAGVEDIAVVEVNDNRLRWAGRFGAKHLINAREGEVSKTLSELAPEGFDVVIDAVGSHETRSLAINSVRRAGRVVFVGLHGNITEIPGNVIIRSEIEVKGSFAYTDEDFLKTINIAKKALYRYSWVGIMSLEDGQRAFEEAASTDTKYVKILLTPGA